jgi:hypothetical protein
MAANSPGREKGTGTMPLTVFEAGSIGVMFSTELYAELGEGNPVGFLCITLGFFNLPNQTGLHSLPPQHKLKSTELLQAQCFYFTSLNMGIKIRMAVFLPEPTLY